VNSPNARSSSPNRLPKTHEFEIDIGQESVGVPHGFGTPSKVYLIGFFGRPRILQSTSKEKMDEMGRSYKVDERSDTPVHLKGIPIYYSIEEGEMRFWPVPAHKWKGVIER
jgi:hypothetical protein